MAIEWPSPRYQSEYEPRTTLPQSLTRAESERLSAVVLRRDASGIDEAVRRRILVDLPEALVMGPVPMGDRRLRLGGEGLHGPGHSRLW